METKTISPSTVHRRQSTRVAAPVTSAQTPPHHHHHHHRSGSSSRPSSSSRPLDSLPDRDRETTNTTRSRRSSTSRDPTVPDRAESTRSSRHKNSSRPHESKYQPEMSGNSAVAQGAPVATPSESKHGGSSSKPPRTRVSINTQTGNWVLGKTIGAGSMGKVKLAKRVEGGEQVAVKIVPRLSTDDGPNQSRADRERADHSKEIRTAREAAIVTLLDHPYICGMVDVKRTSYHWYMLFEYVNGGQMLDYIISHGRLKEKQARKFSRQIASALEYCHRNSIVHRDLKIENILISKTGDIKIIDFGLSNLFSPRHHLKTFCGSLYFAAPELLQAKAYTGPEVDVWSFGIVLYVLVCGKVPFDDQSMPALHAKIKKGLVDYPNWLSVECKGLISKMLVTDPKQRATLQEIMQHPWMLKGFGAPPDIHLPHREPLQLPLDPEVIHAMTGFDFGSAEVIHNQLTKVVESEDYQRAVRLAANQRDAQTPNNTEKRRGFDFNFYKRRNSINSRETLAAPSTEALQLGADPVNAYNPLVSVYYLVREKQERDRAAANPGATSMPRLAGEAPLQLPPDVVEPQAAYTNAATYEMAGEKPTGGRSRPRARTHGEDDIPEAMQNMRLGGTSVPASPAILKPSVESPTLKKESTAAGILRRFSTRRRRDERPPIVTVQSPVELATVPKKSFSVRRTRERDRDHPPTSMQRSGSTRPQHSGLLSPMKGDSSTGKGLGRSSSVNSVGNRRPDRRGGPDAPPRIINNREAPPTSGSDRSNTSGSHPPQNEKVFFDDGAKVLVDDEAPNLSPKSANMRAKSLGHARRESIQARRARREEAREANVPEETDVEAGDQSGLSTDRIDSAENVKPVFLKGLFSVSTTSTKPVSAIRADIIRVLKQVGVEYTEIRGGFSCKHMPSIDLKKVVDNAPQSPTSGPPHSAGHRRRISFGGLMGGSSGADRERDEFRENIQSQKNTRRAPDASYTNSDVSEESFGREQSSSRRAVGETSTHVQSELGGSMILNFEIFIVKVPLLSLHGIQFKRLAGGTWQYKNMADKILRELRL